MKLLTARLAGVDDIGLPETGGDPPIGGNPPTLGKKTAAPAGPRTGGREVLHEVIAKPLRTGRRKVPRLASVSLPASFIDGGHLFGGEVA